MKPLDDRVEAGAERVECEPKHAPLPWHAWNRGIGWEIHAGPDCEEGSDKCNAINDEFRDTFTEVDAKFIALACNSHYDLLAALKECLECEFHVTDKAAIAKAEAAIAKATRAGGTQA